ncbi:UNVERIFIED_CONTAM: hypothetical protein RMT77_012183 [Armadillidium vulgare]
MKSLVFIAFIICDHASSIPFVTDTPEVVAQKQLFQKLYTAAALRAAAAPDIDVYPQNQQQGQHQSGYQQQQQPQYIQLYFPHQEQHSPQQEHHQGKRHHEYQDHQQPNQEHQGDQQQQQKHQGHQQQHQGHQGHQQQHQEHQGHQQQQQEHQGHQQQQQEHQEHQQQPEEHQDHQEKQDLPTNNQHQENYGGEEQGHSNSPNTNEFHSINDKLASIDSNDQQSNQWKDPHASDVPVGLSDPSQVENTPEVNDAIAKFAKAYNAAVLASMAAIVDSSHKTLDNSENSHLRERSAHNTETQSEDPIVHKDENSNSKSKPLDSPEITAAKLHFSKIFQKQLMRLLGLS